MSANACDIHVSTTGQYAGEIQPAEVFSHLKTLPAVVLVDVRTPTEWREGAPDLGAERATPLFLSWKLEPDYALNAAFIDTLKQALPEQDVPVYFLCRSGGRSLSAAIAATQAGYAQAYNVTGGFNAWMDAGLPWRPRA